MASFLCLGLRNDLGETNGFVQWRCQVPYKFRNTLSCRSANGLAIRSHLKGKSGVGLNGWREIEFQKFNTVKCC